jgi:ATP-dependent Lhr-like helicase
VRQTIDDCVHEVMDLAGLTRILEKVRSGEIRCIARDLPEPSPIAAELLNARPYAFLDDAPLEERRTQAVYTRRAFEPTAADDLGALDPAAIERVRDEAWPDIRDADELHDALLTSGFLTGSEIAAGRGGTSWEQWWADLAGSGRARRMVQPTGVALAVAAERAAEIEAVATGGAEREAAVRELLRGRLGIVGPTTVTALAESLGVGKPEVEQALTALEGEGVVLRGRFTPRIHEGDAELEWCDRGLLARIHRYTLHRLRAEIEPVSAADFTRFLFAWQRVAPEHRAAGLEGLAAILGQLDGFEVPAGAWETEVLAARCEEYDPTLLDTLCTMGRVAWGRPALDGPVNGRVDGQTGRRAAGPIRSTPIALFLREHRDLWLADGADGGDEVLSAYGTRVLEVLHRRGASFFQELVSAAGLLPTQVEQALAELAAAGLVSSDGFAGLRALITPSHKRKPLTGGPRRHRTVPFGIESGGRWALLKDGQRGGGAAAQSDDGARLPVLAWILLRRYGVVSRRVLTREANPPSWRDLLPVYRRLEARGEIRGGRFVAGMSGEQFALPEAVVQLRAIRRAERTGELIGISAADPLNLTGIFTPGERIPALAGNRILYKDGVPMLALVGGEVKPLATLDAEQTTALTPALVHREISPALRVRLGMSGTPAAILSLGEVRARRRRLSKVGSGTVFHHRGTEVTEGPKDTK